MGDIIDRKLVASSRHSIFIRGFPGTVNVDEVREFFIREAGTCRIDFNSLSFDKRYLFLALRFDMHFMARDVMARFDGKEVLGHHINIKWFKDLRRARSQVADICCNKDGGLVDYRFQRDERLLDHESYRRWRSCGTLRGGHFRGNWFDREVTDNLNELGGGVDRKWSDSVGSLSRDTLECRPRQRKRGASHSCSPPHGTKTSVDKAAPKEKKKRKSKSRSISCSSGGCDSHLHSNTTCSPLSQLQLRRCYDDSSARMVSVSERRTKFSLVRSHFKQKERGGDESTTEDILKLKSTNLLLLKHIRKDMELAYKQDCETFTTVVKMLISKDVRLEEQLQTCLRETLRDVAQQCLEELRAFMRGLISAQENM